jgi:hypothetical protein
MTFPKEYATPVVDGLNTIPAKVVNDWNYNISQAVDGGSGGSYAPLAELDIAGLGLGRTLPGSGSASGLGYDTFANDSSTDGFTVTAATRLHQRVRDFAPGAAWASTAWTIQNASGLRAYLLGTAVTTPVEIPLDDILQNGEVVTSLTFHYAIAQGHGGLPTNRPTFKVVQHLVGGTNVLLDTIVVPSGGSVAAYEAGGLIQSLVANVFFGGITAFTVNKQDSTYVLEIIDENGTNSQSGNQFYNVLVQGHIPNHQPF